MWRSWLAHLVWDQRVPGSSPGIPTKKLQSIALKLFSLFRVEFHQVGQTLLYSLRILLQTIVVQSIAQIIEE